MILLISFVKSRVNRACFPFNFLIFWFAGFSALIIFYHFYHSHIHGACVKDAQFKASTVLPLRFQYRVLLEIVVGGLITGVYGIVVNDVGCFQVIPLHWLLKVDGVFFSKNWSLARNPTLFTFDWKNFLTFLWIYKSLKIFMTFPDFSGLWLTWNRRFQNGFGILSLSILC